ncbi:hypothetical protein [Actinoplanes sp. NPDC049265]|uniref:hypothetical protein n=1 Tax=Actinoplanes sp. NPDC049265 TaxID=3363902 RepID=UPI0037146C91
MKRPVAAAVAALTVVLVAGCVTRTTDPGSAADPEPSLATSLPPLIIASPAVSPAPARPRTTSKPSRPARTGAPTVRPAPADRPVTPAEEHPVVPTSADLRAALLDPGELSGFEADSGKDSAAGGEGACPALDTDFSGGATARADVLLYNGSTTAFIRERLRQHTPGEAKAALDRIRGVPRKCARYTTSVNGLGEVAVTVRSLGAPGLGDGSAAVRIVMRPRLASIAIIENLVAVRRGGTLILLTHTAVSSIDDRLTSAAISRAVRKTEQVW